MIRAKHIVGFVWFNDKLNTRIDVNVINDLLFKRAGSGIALKWGFKSPLNHDFSVTLSMQQSTTSILPVCHVQLKWQTAIRNLGHPEILDMHSCSRGLRNLTHVPVDGTQFHYQGSNSSGTSIVQYLLYLMLTAHSSIMTSWHLSRYSIILGVNHNVIGLAGWEKHNWAWHHL